MTTIHSAAARSVQGLTAFATCAAIIVGIAGCSNGGSLLSGLGETAATPATTTSSLAVQPGRRVVSVAPLIGPPSGVATGLAQQLTSELQKSGVRVASASGQQSDYTLRGYIVAAREGASTKVSYIWDVTNPSNVRVHRITGEEVVPSKSSDPWGGVSAATMQRIASKTTTSLSAWLPRPTGPAASQSNSSVSRTAATQNRPARPASSTAGISSKSLSVVVPRVVGAPGDGSTALASALRRQLQQTGIAIASGGATTTAHRVEGTVVMGAANGGKQPISIDWVVKSPTGTKLGTVSQKNEIPAGSLNGQWGGTAAAAAAAASQGIVRLLPRKTASR
ncbi:MAG: hypothetical protein ACR2PG_21820 [Hyphomicrobiaceae bacterium]